jgi:hypothetical protein
MVDAGASGAVHVQRTVGTSGGGGRTGNSPPEAYPSSPKA